MKYGKLLIILTMLMGITTTMSAKDGYKAMKVYMFGVSISFNDSIVNFTDIQAVDVYIANDKPHFLLNREDYSYQLRYYIERIQANNHPTCLVVYGKTEKEAMKKYLKMQARYTKKAKKTYVINAIPSTQFKFQTMLPDDLREKKKKNSNVKQEEKK